jgi:hypothetical protein
MSVQVLPTIKIHKGTDFETKISIGLTSLNSGIHSTVSKIRKHPSSLDFEEFGTYIDNSSNSVVVSMGKTITENLPLGRNYFDVFLINNITNKTVKLVEGSIIVNDSASK